MKKLIFSFFLFLCIFNGLIAANVSVSHTVEKNSEKNEYRITSVFLGLSNAEFAKASFIIPKEVNVITPSSGVNVAKKESDGISIYSLSVGDEGVTTVFYIQPSVEQDISIGVKFIYAVGENKMKPIFKNLIISIKTTDYDLYQGVTPKDNSFVIKDLSNNNSDVSGTAENRDSKESAENRESRNHSENITNHSVNGDYSIQLLSLAEYSDLRVMEFCIKHKLKTGDLIKRNVGDLTKVSIGTYSSKEAANLAKKKMISGDALLDDAFVVRLN